MTMYTWKNTVTNEVTDTNSYNTPPCCDYQCGGVRCAGECQWKRVYTFGLSSVEGGGGSPSRRASK